jgi:5-methylcytosine-specific restriction endonuclease McrA
VIAIDLAAPRAKRCAGACGRLLGLDAYHRDAARADGRVARCRPCVAGRDAARYVANADALRTEAAQHYRDNRDAINARRSELYRADVEARRAKSRAYDTTHPEVTRAKARRWAAAHPERANAGKRAWDRAHPLSRKLCLARYRARLRAQQLHPIATAALAGRVAVFGDACAYCGGEWSHLDHVKPVALGGAHCLSNLRPACARCNHRKGSTPAAAWLAALPKAQPLPLPIPRQV